MCGVYGTYTPITYILIIFFIFVEVISDRSKSKLGIVVGDLLVK